MLKRIPKIKIPRLALGLCLLALAFCLWPSQSALAQKPSSGEPRYCTWLFWSKEPALIKLALERMALGDPFMVVAREAARKNPKHSQANADCMRASGMDPAVLAIVKNLKIGEISRPFDLGGGTALVMRTTDEHRRKAQEFYSKGRYSQAERELLRDLKLHPASSAAWHMLALTRTAQGNYKQALAALDKALIWSPGNPAMLNDKASALANLGRSKKAVPVFEKALKLDPKNPTIMSNLAWALTLARKKPKRAVALAKQACDEAPQEARFWHTLGKVQAAQGHHGKALVSFRQALVLAPKNKAVRQDLVKSIKTLDPKVLARLSQAAPPPVLKPKTKPKSKTKEKTDENGKGLKPAPDLSGPAIALPSQWPTLPKAKAKAEAKPKAEPKTAAMEKSTPEPQAKTEPQATSPAKPSSGASGRIVSLPMPKFPEPPPAPPVKTKDVTPDSHDRAYKNSSPMGNQTKAAANPTPAKAGKASAKPDSKAKQAKAKTAPFAKPKAVEAKTKPPKPEPKKSQVKAEQAKPKAKPEKTKPQAEAKSKAPAKAKAAAPKPEPAKAEAKKPEAKPAEKTAAKAAPPKPAPSQPKELAKAESKATTTPGPSEAETSGKPHYLIQVASYRPESLAKKELRAWQRRKLAGHIETWQDKRGRTWHRVLLGPYANQKTAENKAKALKAKRLVRDYYVVKRPAD